ncbi:protein of unknown function [Caminicella sporogenes DSM 14501]|uniref:DUF4363 family protein n=1 Tax=Caminicella sporogenes DSM 14501 TaxID=1121266 RepID=A0A1M6S5T8_9FIRM|nr:DUF4363 family protein [Caminicella sporogenes]RKD27205.1 hypothetical protein BET04_09835 [Caminicella sporogenes]SHK40051.1 protein of unknown function [Caminicella sporogenes DSM 14501]
MKSLFISTLLIVLLLLNWIFTFNFIADTSKELTMLTQKIEYNIVKDQWFSAQKNLKLLETKWNNSLKILKLVINHDEIEKTNLSLIKVRKYILTQNKDNLLVETSLLKFHINHIKENESLSLRNIF